MTSFYVVESVKRPLKKSVRYCRTTGNQYAGVFCHSGLFGRSIMERRCMSSTKSDQYVPSELCLVEGGTAPLSVASGEQLI